MFHRMMNYGELEARPTETLTRELIKKLLPKYKRHDDLLVVQELAWEEFKKALPVPVVRDENSPFSIDEDELASLVCQTIQKPLCRRLAVDKGVQNDDYRTPNIDLILGDNGVVNHKENQIIYRFDITKCMFSFGNINEKMRMAGLNCSQEIVVDLFAGIGYFSLPLLIHAKAKHLYACEWNPNAIDAFKKNLALNKVDPNRCTIIEGDNRSNRPTDVAQRVILGILPSCMDWMHTAFECIDKSSGATLHCHDLVETKPLPTIPPEDVISIGEASDTNPVVSGSNSRQSNVQSSQGERQASPLNQSTSTTSSSSHSTLEKLSAPSTTDEKITHSSESDKDNRSPVMLDKPSASDTSATAASNDTSSNSSHNEDSINNEQMSQITDHELDVYETRGQALIDKIREDVEAHDLRVKLINIQPVKSYAPHIKHVVFDIKIEPKSSS